MGYTIRQMDAEHNFCQELTVEALQRAVPRDAIAAVLQETGNPVQRARKLTAEELSSIRMISSQARATS